MNHTLYVLVNLVSSDGTTTVDVGKTTLDVFVG